MLNQCTQSTSHHVLHAAYALTGIFIQKSIGPIHKVRVSPSIFSHVLKSADIISSSTEVSNLLSFVKSLADSKDSATDSISLLSLAYDFLNRFLDEKEDSELNYLIQFITEQLALCQKSNFNRRYSSNLISLSFLWNMTSHSLYARLREIFILPTTRRLQQLSSSTQVSTEIDTKYIQKRSEALSEKEKIVVLIIDEIYTASRVECTGGKLIGVTDEGRLSKTVLAFMLQSICGKYKDVVKLVPVENLSTDILFQNFNAVMSSLSSVYFVIAVSLDNHVVNR